MHFASQEMISKMALAEGGLWPAWLNGDRDLALVVKATTDTIKWIQRGVVVDLLIAHVEVGERVVRCIGLQVADSAEEPLLLSGPQNLAEDHRPFDELLCKESFIIYFHNENPFISILDGVAKPDKSSVKQYESFRHGVQLYGDPSDFSLFRVAQEIFEGRVLKGASDSESQYKLHRIPLKMHGLKWNSVAVPETGTFDPSNRNEGGSQEDLIIQVLKPHFQGTVVKSPAIPDGKGSRELCDVIAVAGPILFLFESKAFSVFDKATTMTPERRAKTIFGHFEKAASQLQGAIRKISDGATIESEVMGPMVIRSADFKAIHAIVLVSTSSWHLPWTEIGHRLQELCKRPIYFHLLTAMDLQRVVAYCLGDPLRIHEILDRRSGVVCESGNANVRTELVPAPPTQLSLPEVSDSNQALGFAFGVGQGSLDLQGIVAVMNLCLTLLQSQKFTGRIEIRGDVGHFKGANVFWLAMAAGGSKMLPFEGDKNWWFSLLRELRVHSLRDGIPVPLPRSGRLRPNSTFKRLFPDLIVSVEFFEGRVTGRVYAEGTGSSEV